MNTETVYIPDAIGNPIESGVITQPALGAAELSVVTTALAKFDRVSAGLASLREKHAGVVYPVQTTAGLAAARKARGELRDVRNGIEDTRKAAKAPLLEIGRKLDATAKRIATEVEKIESPIAAQIAAEESRKESIRKEKEEAERQRVAKIMAMINDLRDVPIKARRLDAFGISATLSYVTDTIIGPEFEEFSGTAEECKRSTIQALESLLADQERREAEERRLAEERAALEAEKIKQHERHEAAQKEMARLRAEHEATQRAERERIAEVERMVRADLARAEAANAAKRKAQDDAREAAIAEENRLLAERRAELAREEVVAKARRDAEIAAETERLRAAEIAVETERLRAAAEVQSAIDADERAKVESARATELEPVVETASPSPIAVAAAMIPVGAEVYVPDVDYWRARAESAEAILADAPVMRNRKNYEAWFIRRDEHMAKYQAPFNKESE